MSGKTRVLKRGTETLPTELTKDELLAKAAELAEVHERLALEREAQKQTKADLKARLEELEQRRNELARVVQRKKEDRVVDIEIHANDGKGVVEYLRMDTGEVYTTRPLSADERQLSILGPPAVVALPPVTTSKH